MAMPLIVLFIYIFYMKGWESPDRQEHTTANHRPLYSWQPSMSLEQVPEKVRDLITSDEKLKVFELISFNTGTFTAKDIHKKLQEHGFDVKLSTIQVLLRGLCYRQYLQQFEYKLGPHGADQQITFKKPDQFIKI